MKNDPVITIENAGNWAIVFALAEQINAMKSVREFYGIVEPPCHGLRELYDCLHGWRKRAFRAYIMSGRFILDRWSDGSYDLKHWGCRHYNEHVKLCNVEIHRYYPRPMGLEDFEEEETQWGWDQLCAALSI